MRTALVCAIVAIAAANAQAYHAIMSLETPGSVYDPGLRKNLLWDLRPAFRLNIMLYSDDPKGMCSFQVTLTGNAGFAYKTALRQSGLVKNYNYDLGWDQANGLRWAAGVLPMPGPPANQVGTIALGDDGDPDTYDYGQDGLAAYVEFTSCPPLGLYEIGGMGIAVGDSQSLPQPMQVTLIPLLLGVPEPAAGFLMLAVLPLLLRR